jgi:glycosyltransferase involved in cell wall biosynthesis
VKILFIHQNFPGQFLHLAPALVELGHNVHAFLHAKNKVPENWHGVELHPYRVQRSTTAGVHPWVSDIETKTIRAEACFLMALALKESGFEPDVVIAHPGWGESLFIKEVWPETRLGIYSEYFYQKDGGDWNFDPEFASTDPGGICRLHFKNLATLYQFESADLGIAPTTWQADSFPLPFRRRISVIHDGIDSEQICPNPRITFIINSQLSLTRQDEVITFVNRNLEPLRGYHVFMRALPALLKKRPRAHVLIVGGDGVSYGAKPEQGATWKQIFIDEVRADISDEDWGRVHFLGRINRKAFTALLQVSTVHVYLTYPFVLSWSLLEAMCVGCAIVAADIAPVREVIHQNKTGILVDFFDSNGLVNEISMLLDDPQLRLRLGSAARAFAQERYDLKTVCLPKQLQWVEALADRSHKA